MFVRSVLGSILRMGRRYSLGVIRMRIRVFGESRSYLPGLQARVNICAGGWIRCVARVAPRRRRSDTTTFSLLALPQNLISRLSSTLAHCFPSLCPCSPADARSQDGHALRPHRQDPLQPSLGRAPVHTAKGKTSSTTIYRYARNQGQPGSPRISGDDPAALRKQRNYFGLGQHCEYTRDRVQRIHPLGPQRTIRPLCPDCPDRTEWTHWTVVRRRIEWRERRNRHVVLFRPS